jgi:hypothetical protein
MTTRLEDTAPAKLYDNALRWEIPSDSDPHAVYVVELHGAPGFSVYTCKHFECRLGPLLARGVSPEQALAEGLVKLCYPGQRDEDALKCKHVLDAEKRFALAAIASLSRAQEITEGRR